MKRIIIYVNFIVTFLIMAFGVLNFSYAQQPSYQVSLFISLHPKGPPIHLCNGAIVQSKLILTTAACVHYMLIPNRPIIPVHPSMLTVIAGSSNALTDALSIEVAEIIFHQEFNETTMENDLAFLRLKTDLPLGTRDDIKWVILDEYKANSLPCLASFHVRHTINKVSDYSQAEKLQILDNKVCNNYSSFPEAHKEDICSNYVLPPGFKCAEFISFLPFNGDRGTGLICNSHLVGLLSFILPLENMENIADCSEKIVKAFYTYIGTHIEWVYGIIAEEEYVSLMNQNYVVSAPYDQATEAIIQSKMTETSTTVENSTLPSTTLNVKQLQSGATDIISNISNKIISLLNLVCYFL